jgi:outer membrane protein assembly factor BamB
MLRCWFAVLFASILGAENWPSYRGPQGSGVSSGPAPWRWNADASSGPVQNVLWRTPIPGLGHASPIVWGNRLFVATAVRTKGEAPLRVGLYGDGGSADDNAEQSWKLFCLDRATGRVVWERTAKTGMPRAARHSKATHANTTLATDGRHLIAFFGSEGLFAYDLTGRLLWQQDLGVLDMTPADDRTLSWGFASSPIVAGDKVIVQCDAKSGSFLAAYGLADGKLLWKTDRSAVSLGSWGTPGVWGDLVVCNGYPFVAGYDVATGRERWRVPAGGDVPVPVPFFANGLIYVAQAHGQASPLIAIRPNGEVAWREERNGAYLSTPVAYQGKIYSVTSAGVLKAYEGLTGRKLYEQRLGTGAYTASPIAAGGRVYVVSEEGEVSVVAAGPEFRVLAKNPLGEITLATPAVADGTLYFRTRREILAIRD